MNRDYAALLSERLTPRFLDPILSQIKQYPEDIEMVYGLISHPDTIVAWRATWACEKWCREFPDWFLDKREDLMALSLQARHKGIKRLILAILNQLPVPESISVPFLNSCLEGMFSFDEPSAIQSLYIKLSYKLCLAEPGLLPELKMLLESAEPQYYQMAVKTARKNILLRLDKIK